ncbi:MAG: hypothetical protein WBG02_13620 [Candidatus Acidiferrum sp.]
MWTSYKPSKLSMGVLGATVAFIAFFHAVVTRRGTTQVVIDVITGIIWVAATIRYFRHRTRLESESSGARPGIN